MSKTKGLLQKPDAEMLAQVTTINAACHANAAAWGLTDQQLTLFDALLAAAKRDYEANIDKATKNATTAVAKRTSFGELKNFVGMLINALEGNTAVPDAAIELMGLRPRHPKKHLPLPRPTEPIVITVRRQHDEITVYASRPEHDQPTATVGPVTYHGFKLRYRIDEQTEYKVIVSTRLHHTLFFDRTDEGKRLYISAAWVNPRLEEGPWCEEIMEIIG
jgi:hypothetical protein